MRWLVITVSIVESRMEEIEDERDDDLIGDEVSGGQGGKNSSIVNLGDEEVLLGVSTRSVRMPGEQTNNFLQRITHLHCQGMKISMIADLRSVRNLTVLYLYNNKIKVIDCMSHVPHLKLLYLQNNLIEEMKGLEDLISLGNY